VTGGPDVTGPAPDGPDLPPMLAARPRDARRGLPIPPVNEHPDPSGGRWHVDFTTINTTISTRLATERRCSLCGEPMGYWVIRAKLQQMQHGVQPIFGSNRRSDGRIGV
jgi:hypothetical protein